MTHAPARALPLSDRTLDRLPAAVSGPDYDRTALRPGTVHFGVGGFHRAHQAVYLDDLARLGHTDWGTVGVGLHSREIGEVLDAQDRLYLVVERAADGDDVRVVGAMTRYLHGPDDPEAVLATLTAESTRVVTLTITGTSYRIDPHTGKYDPDDEDVQADLRDPARPRTVFGYLVEALSRRRQAGLAPFTVLSCDNMQHNGAAARTAAVSSARLRDGELAAWIDEHVAFPSSMVDRITPTTTPEEREAVVARTGVDDAGDLDRWVTEEKDVVTAHLRTALCPDPEVQQALRRLAERFGLAAVTSSACSRLDACLEVTGLAPFFPEDQRFSAEDSLPEPTSKPDPAVYALAGRRLGITPDEGVAVEDSVNGALSAVAAGYRTLGTVVFVPPELREERSAALRQVGVVAVVTSWPELADLLL